MRKSYIKFSAEVRERAVRMVLNNEVIHRRGPWKSLDAVEYETLEWVHWFNHKRLLGPIGNIPPAEAEANFYMAMDDVKLAA